MGVDPLTPKQLNLVYFANGGCPEVDGTLYKDKKDNVFFSEYEDYSYFNVLFLLHFSFVE